MPGKIASREAVRAYYFLLTRPPSFFKTELDQVIESWFDSKWQCQVNFEIGDGIRIPGDCRNSYFVAEKYQVDNEK